VERFTVPGDGSVNSWIVDAPGGLIVVDVQRDRASAAKLIERVKARGKPLAAVLLTHPHPDHVGGLQQFREAFPDAPVHAGPGTARELAADRMGFLKIALGAEAPRGYPQPTSVFAPDKPIRVAGLTIETREYGSGESIAATSFHLPTIGALFGGDIATADVEDFLMEGRTGPWLLQVAALRRSHPGARTLYPGHGEAGPVSAIADATVRTLRTYRRLVTAAGPVRGVLPPDKVRSVAAQVKAELGERTPVAEIPNLVEENVRAVARELAQTRR
jgi:glyoxylase-like metal-dependent hydrolase (beta-lactamase superfamily II)